MIDTVLFDMGGTLEDIWVDDESRHSSIQGVLDILHAHGIDLNMDFETTAQSINAGWERYGAYRDPRQRELKPEEIWGSFVLTDFGLNEDSVRPYAEELAHMWEITHYHRTLRPHVKEMLEGLKGLGMKLGVISNTASLYQVFDVLKDYGIRDYFQDVTLSSVTGYRKPDPNIFLVSLQQGTHIPVQLADCNHASRHDKPSSFTAPSSAIPQALSADSSGGANHPPNRDARRCRSNVLDITPPAYTSGSFPYCS